MYTMPWEVEFIITVDTNAIRRVYLKFTHEGASYWMLAVERGVERYCGWNSHVKWVCKDNKIALGDDY